MPRPQVRKLSALTAAVIAAAVPASRSSATAYTWTGPYSGTSTVNLNPWSNASSWSGNQIPASSVTTQLVFTNFDSNTYTAINNLSSPSFALNNLTIENGSQGGTVTITSLNASSGTYQIQMAGASPTLNLSGPSGDIIGTQTSGAGYGLFLNPTSGTTTINDSGNGLITLGSGSVGINGSGGLAINDSGLASISIFSPSSAYSNSFTGGVDLISGSLEISSALSLGTNTLTVNGGNLRSTSATFANPIVANSDLVIFSGSPTLQGVISGNGGLHLYSGAAFSSENVTLSNTETYQGATTIDSGPLRTSSSNLGSLTLSPGASILNTSAINLGQEATLTITAGATNSALSSSTPITLSGAYLSTLGTNAATAESLGTVSNTGLTTLAYTSVSGSATNTLNFGAYTPTDHATLFLRGNWQGSGGSGTVGVANFSSGITTVSDSNAPAGYAPIVPFAVAATTSATSTAFNAFVTRTSSGLSVIPVGGSGVTQFGSLANGFASLPASDVYLNVNQSTTVSGNAQVYALAAGAGGISYMTIGGTGSLNIASGVMIVTSGVGLSGPTINFGGNTGYIHAGYAGSSLAIYDTASQMTGSNGLVISAPAETTVALDVEFSDINGSTDSSNPFTGGLTLNGGVNLEYTNDLQLGAAGQSITFDGGILMYNGTAAATLSRPIRLGTSGGGVTSGSSSPVTVSSLISGPGGFYMSTGFVGGGTTVLSNSSNSYSGGTYLYTGTLKVNADGDLGAAGAPLILAGGTLQFGGPATLSRPMPIWAASTIDTNGYSSTIAGSLSSVAVTGGFTVIGGGTLNLTGPNALLSGSLTVSNATLAVTGNGTLPQVPNVTVAAGGAFQFNNSAANLSTRYSPLGRVTLIGGTLDLLGNSTTASSQTIGGINLTPNVNVSSSTVSVEPASATLTVANDVVGGSSYSLVTASATSPISSYTSTSLTAGPQSLTKLGSGTLVLAGANSFTGGLVVSTGTVKTTNPASLGFGAVVPPTLSSEATIGSTAVSNGGSLDLGGTSITEPVMLNGGSLLNSSSTPASLSSGVKGISFNPTTTSVNYAGVSGQTVGSSGVGYLPGDTVTYTGGSGASASLILGLTSASFNVSYGGNYTQASSGPNITISSSNGVGTGATGVPITDENNDITGIDITNPGYGYTAAPVITITAIGTNITPAVVTGTATGFGVVGIQQTAAGTGYSSAATTAVNSVSGSGLQLNSPVVSSLTLQSTSSVGGNGNITISPTITGSGGLIKIGSDTVFLSASNSYDGNTVISAGLIVAAQGLASLGTSSTITVNGGNLILKNTSAATVFSMLQSGYDAGAWDGTGINSASAEGDTTHLHAIGMLQPASDIAFEGQPLDADDVAVKYTYYGDADLTGTVDGSDYSRIDNSYVYNSTYQNTPLTGWSNGDFNYDGVVDGSDYTLIDNAFNSQGASLAAAVTTAEIAGLSSSVPEPSVLCLIGLGTIGLLRRRRRG